MAKISKLSEELNQDIKALAQQEKEAMTSTRFGSGGT